MVELRFPEPPFIRLTVGDLGASSKIRHAESGRLWDPPRFLMLLGDLIKTRLRMNRLPPIALALFLAPHLSAATGPSVQIPRIDRPPTLADFGGMEPNAGIAGRMLKVTGFVVREPADGTQPSQNTDVYLAYDQHNLYAVFVC